VWRVLDPPPPSEITQAAVRATAGATSPADALARLQNDLLTNNTEDPRAQAGSSYGRIVRFLDEDRIGNAEQFAGAFALMARSLGFPARVVVGYKVAEERNRELVPITDVTTNQYHAWVEVKFEGLGWVPFDPTPAPGTGTGGKKPAATPPTTIVPAPGGGGGQRAPQEAGPTEARPDATAGGGVALVAVVAVSAVGLAAVALVLALLAVAVLKRRRRARRRSAAGPAARLLGAWDEVVDRLRERRVAVDASMTPADVTRSTAEVFGPTVTAPLAAIAPHVSRALYAPDEPPAELAEQVWRSAEFFERQFAATTTRRRRLLARLDPTPLRSPGA
jgi:hypothetical protein